MQRRPFIILLTKLHTVKRDFVHKLLGTRHLFINISTLNVSLNSSIIKRIMKSLIKFNFMQINIFCVSRRVILTYVFREIK